MLSTPTPLAMTTGCRTGKSEGCAGLGIVPQAFLVQRWPQGGRHEMGCLYVGCVEQSVGFHELERVLHPVAIPTSSAVCCFDAVSDDQPARSMRRGLIRSLRPALVQTDVARHVCGIG